MTYSIQLAVDSVNPHTQADWWAETLGWTVEPSDEAFIRSMIDQGFATGEDTLVHNGVLVWGAGAAICPAEEVEQPAGAASCSRPRRRERRSKTGCTGTYAWTARTRTRCGERLEARGATFLWTASQGPHSWYTMADPEGNEFCIS